MVYGFQILYKNEKEGLDPLLQWLEPDSNRRLSTKCDLDSSTISRCGTTPPSSRCYLRKDWAEHTAQGRPIAKSSLFAAAATFTQDFPSENTLA